MDFREGQSVLIVGAGVFGLSTALHLLRRGWKDITIIDRSLVLPAPDAASTDINKIVRSSYNDPVYTRFARDAIAAWKDRDEWGDTYHESGVIVRGGRDTFAHLALRNDTDMGANVEALHSAEDLRAHLPKQVPLGSALVSNFEGYINFDGGWASAEQGVKLAMEKVLRLGAQIIPGRTAIGLLSDGRGVMLEDGNVIAADLVIIASGSWTASSFPGLGLEDRITATGQSVASIQLTDEEAKRYADVPVILDYLSGFYVFPPNAFNVVKCAIHAVGYANPQGITAVSTPRTHVTHPGSGTIPREMAQSLRECLTSIYPEFGRRPFAGTRLCWYCDTPDSDWLIDFHPEHPSVLFATGGSGHAYKFLPTIGRLVVDRLENKLEPSLAKKFSFDRIWGGRSDLTRQEHPPKWLDCSQLWNDEK